jgi:hypothetical protein
MVARVRLSRPGIAMATIAAASKQGNLAANFAN